MSKHWLLFVSYLTVHTPVPHVNCNCNLGHSNPQLVCSFVLSVTQTDNHDLLHKISGFIQAHNLGLLYCTIVLCINGDLIWGIFFRIRSLSKLLPFIFLNTPMCTCIYLDLMLFILKEEVWKAWFMPPRQWIYLGS